MNCNDVRKYFYAFLDDELDVEKNIEVLAHVDMCCECGRRMEKERLLQNRVREAVCEVKAPDYLVDAVLRGAEEKPNFFLLLVKTLLSGWRLVPVAGFAAAMIMIVYLFVIPGNVKKDDVLYLAESKYHNYMMQQLDLDIRSQDPATVVEYLRGQTNSKVVLPEIGDDVKLVGAALSEIDGVKVSQVFYIRGETPVSFMIFCNPDSGSGQSKNIDFSGMKEIFVDETVVYYDEGYCGHCQIMGWEDAGSQYVVVSMLNSDEILKMLNKT
jgi:anti-sigma factor RsiW